MPGSIIYLCYNKNDVLASCCEIGSFGLLYSINDKEFQDICIGEEELISCDWSPDGNFLAISVLNNKIFFRDKDGDEFHKMYNESTVWRVKFHPFPRTDGINYFYTLDFAKIIKYFYFNTNLKQIEIIKTVELQEIPTSISYMPSAFAFILTDKGGSVQLWYPELIFVNEIGKFGQKEAASAGAFYQKNNDLSFIAGSEEGSIKEFKITLTVDFFSSAGNRFAYSDGNTFVIVQHLKTNKRKCIENNEIALKISLYKRFLGILLPSEIMIYHVNKVIKKNMDYKYIKRIHYSYQINLFQILSSNFIYCNNRSLKVINDSKVVKLYNFDFQITCCTVGRTQEGMEELYLGLKNGDVKKIFLNNLNPQIIFKGDGKAVKFLSLSKRKENLMIIDENNTLGILHLKIDLNNKHPREYDSISNVTGASWNSEIEEMFCYTTIGYEKLMIKLAGIHNKEGSEMIKNLKTMNEFGPIEIKFIGTILRFDKSDIIRFYKYQTLISSFPVCELVQQLIFIKNFPKALEIAYLGIPVEDWQKLAEEALKNNDFEIAARVYKKFKDYPNINFTGYLIDESQKGSIPSHEIDAELKARDGKFNQTAKIYHDKNHGNKAFELADTMKNSDILIPLLENKNKLEKNNKIKHDSIFCKPCPLRKSNSVAEVKASEGQFEIAQTIYRLNGEKEKELDNIIKCEKIYEAYEFCKQLDCNVKKEREKIEKCLDLFIRKKHFDYIKEMMIKLDKKQELLNLYTKFEKWEEAIKFSKQNNLNSSETAEQYLLFMKKKGKNEEILDFYLANYQIIKNNSFVILNDVLSYMLDKNAFSELFRCYWALSRNLIGNFKNKNINTNKEFNNFQKYIQLSNIYFAYRIILTYQDKGVISSKKDENYTLKILHASSFVLNLIQKDSPQNIEKVIVLNILGITCEKLGLFQTAKIVFLKLLTYKLSESIQRETEIRYLKIKNNSIPDKEGIQSKCYNCNKINKIFPPSENDKCQFCTNNFIRCHETFQVIPLIEFSDISKNSDSRIQFPGSPCSSKNENDFLEVLNSRMLSTRGSSKNVVSPMVILERKTVDQSVFSKKRSSLTSQKSTISFPEVRISEENNMLDQPIELIENEISDKFTEDFSKVNTAFPIKFYKHKSNCIKISQCIDCMNFFLNNQHNHESINSSNCYFCSHLKRINKNKCVKLKFKNES